MKDQSCHVSMYPDRNHKRLNMPVTLMLVAMWALSLIACSPAKDQQAQASVTPHNVTLTPAQQKSIHLYTVVVSQFHAGFDTTGVVDFDRNQATSVLAPFSGSVIKLLVTPGQQVKQGQALATVNSPDFAAAAGAYRKALAVAHAADLLAATDRDLAAHHALSQRENAQAQADAISAESDRDAALQTLLALHVDSRTIADIRQGKSAAYAVAVIRAPIAGTVVEKSITPGQLLQAGSTPCFIVANLAHVWVMAHIYGAAADAVHPGDSAQIETGFGAKSLIGKVINVSADVDPDSQSVLARVLVKNPDDLLKKQMYVAVRIRSADTSSGLLVPVSAILRDDENLPLLYVADANGSYARRHVTLGYRDGDRILVTHGLVAGDKIVAEGGIFLRFIQTQ